jgi:hypothetical protein
MNAQDQIATIARWLDARPRVEVAWDECREQRLSQVAESYDPDSGAYRRLGPVRSW